VAEAGEDPPVGQFFSAPDGYDRPMTWGTTPRQSIEAACVRRGVGDVVSGCLALMRGEEADPGLVVALAGPGQERFLDKPEKERYWLRVWGARGLLWALHVPGAPGSDDQQMVAAVVDALGDGHWRVREMAVKLAARHRVEPAQPVLAALVTDENERVRKAAARAVRSMPGPDPVRGRAPEPGSCIPR
jgi:HEAT repeats